MKYIIIALLLAVSLQLNAQKSDAHIIGHVTCMGEHIAFANVMIENTTIGTSTDETGHFNIINIPEGSYTVVAQSLGYKPDDKIVTIKKGETIELKFELLEDVFGLEEVVVTGDRNKKNRKESAVIVNTLTQKELSSNNSTTISEGLNYCSGLRVENNCQNCGFNQLRMNGMEGPYSQVLINSRAIFSGLAGVYGLELIPTNMIERVEIVRGGGSALYGSNAIAGTVNLILKDPINNTYEFGTTTNFIGVGLENVKTPSLDINVNMNASVVSSDSKTGISIYGFHRQKEPFDANNDSFSEQSQAKNTTVGTRIFHRFNTKSKITFDYFTINEDRRGGNKFDNLPHMSDITESVEHSINNGALNFDYFLRERDQIAVYASAQHIDRDSYYGANYSLADYGNTKDFSYTSGIQYTLRAKNSTLVSGAETTGSFLTDKKLGYPDYSNATITENQIENITFTENTTIANQKLNTYGIFAQYDYKYKWLKISAGGRFDNYLINDINDESQKRNGKVFSPRANLLFDIAKNIQTRLSYSQGYRAPQIFDEDLHIETSGSRKIIHKNSSNLQQETSHSISASVDIKQTIKNVNISFLAEGFYTQLNNPFVNQIGTPDEFGTVIYTRINADAGATVQGINFELNIYPSAKTYIRSGFTLQKSVYQEEQEFNEKTFLRTPNTYGFFAFDYNPTKKLGFSTTGTYTGKMLVPYFGNTLSNPELGELRTSQDFFDLGFKAKYNIKLNGASLQFMAGIKNIFNSYQKDFDMGADRDPAYIYGPGTPRIVYIGIKLGNTL